MSKSFKRMLVLTTTEFCRRGSSDLSLWAGGGGGGYNFAPSFGRLLFIKYILFVVVFICSLT